MVSIKTSHDVLSILFIRLYTYSNLFGASDKKTKITRKLCSIPPPRVMDKLALQIKYDPPKFKKMAWELVSDINSFP